MRKILLYTMTIIQTHIVPENADRKRFNDYAFGIIQSIPSRSGIKKAIKRGLLIIDGKKSETGRWITPGQKIELIENPQIKPKPYKMNLQIVFEDDHIIVINKPAGLVSSGNQFKTAVNAVCHNAKPSKKGDRLDWPKPAHRLDSATSGLLLFAKSTQALLSLNQQFEKKTIKKRYRAIVNGKIDQEGLIDLSIDDKAALTRYLRINFVESLQNQWLSHVDLFPESGRTHQLRIHLSKMGHPIVGDKIYGKEGDILKHKGLFLCAIQLEFVHPETNQNMILKIEEPPKFNSLLKREKRRWEKYN